MRRPSRPRVRTLLVALGLLGGCAPPEDIRVGMLATFEGDSVIHPDLRAAELAVQQANDSGGVRLDGRRHRLELVVRDDQNRADVAVTAALGLINQDGVVALIGPHTSRQAIPVAAAVERAGIPMITTGSTNVRTTLGRRFVFRIPFVDSFQGESLASFARTDLDAAAAAVLYDQASAYSRDLADVFRARFQEGGGQITAFESYTTDRNQDFGPQLTRIAQSGATVLFLPNLGDDVVEQARQVRDAGIAVTLLGGDSWPIDRIPMLEDFAGAYFANAYLDGPTQERRARFESAISDRFRVSQHVAAAYPTYDAVGLLIHALATAGSTDPAMLREALAATQRYLGVTGAITYRGTGDPVKSLGIFRVQDGAPVLAREVEPGTDTRPTEGPD